MHSASLTKDKGMVFSPETIFIDKSVARPPADSENSS